MAERIFNEVLAQCGAVKLVEVAVLTIFGACTTGMLAMLLLPNNPTIIEEKESN